ncbi:MAG: hypothetical protein KJP12_07810 [Acidimicrobiia bacterium]|nr:hypothetical protein [Acidimicrobiia bacterium]
MIAAVLDLPRRRPVAVAASMVAAMVSYHGLVSAVSSQPAAPSWLPWVIAIVITWAVAGLLLAPRIRSGSRHLAAVMLGAAASPGFATGSARALGAPGWVGLMGVVLSVALMAWAIRALTMVTDLRRGGQGQESLRRPRSAGPER